MLQNQAKVWKRHQFLKTKVNSKVLIGLVQGKPCMTLRMTMMLVIMIMTMRLMNLAIIQQHKSFKNKKINKLRLNKRLRLMRPQILRPVSWVGSLGKVINKSKRKWRLGNVKCIYGLRLRKGIKLRLSRFWSMLIKCITRKSCLRLLTVLIQMHLHHFI